MKKIVIIAPAHPLRGGLADSTERLAQEMLGQGHEVIIYTFSLQYPNLLFPGKTQYTDKPKPKGLDIRVKVNSINPFNWLSVGREVKKMAPDLVIMRYWIPFMGPSLGTIARIIRSNGKTRVIPICDNVIPHEKRPGDRILTNYFINSCDGFITLSKAVLDDIDQFDKQKPRQFSPHPLYDSFGEKIEKSAAKKALGLDENTNYMMFFGFVRAYKGLDLLIDAFAEPEMRELPLKLIIAGEYYQDDGPYLEQIKKHGLEDHIVHRKEFISDADVGKYFCAVDLVVQPYKSATQSGVTQIAYHFNTPMIVTNVSGLPEMVPDNKVGYVVERDPKDIARAILRFYRENKEAEFRLNIDDEKPKYSWAKLAEVIFSLI